MTKACNRTCKPSVGSMLVAERGAQVGLSTLARELGCSMAMAQHVAKGIRRPGDDLMAKFESLGIPPAAFDAAPSERSKWAVAPNGRADLGLDPTSESGDETALVVRQGPTVVAGLVVLRETIETYRRRLEAAEKDKLTKPTTFVALLRGQADAAAQLAKLQGEHEITTAQIVRSKAWGDILRALGPVLDEHPDVAAKIQQALEALEAV